MEVILGYLGFILSSKDFPALSVQGGLIVQRGLIL